MKKSVLIGIIVAAVVIAGVVGGIVIGTSSTTTTKPEHIHTIVIDPASPAGCLHGGFTEGKHCSECGEILVPQQPTDSLGHEEVVDQKVEPTCTSTGLTEGKHCSRCNDVLEEQGVISMLPHTYDDDYDAKCNVCDFERAVACRHDDPTKIIVVEAVEPTCQKTGLTEGMKCTLCGTMVVPQAIAQKIDCIESDWTIDKEATKTEDGKRHKECSMCGKPMGEEIIPATGSIGLNYDIFTISNGLVFCSVGLSSSDDPDVVILSTYRGVPVNIIRVGAFRYCTSITSVRIPNSVNNINEEAFYGCTSLETIIFEGTVDEWNAISFGDDWKYGVPAKEVICSDGTVTLE